MQAEGHEFLHHGGKGWVLSCMAPFLQVRDQEISADHQVPTNTQSRLCYQSVIY
jgi:hypothetical protein